MTDDILAELFRHNTAIHAADMFDDPDFNNPVTVGYCPLVYKDNSSRTSFDLSDSSISNEARAYLEKVNKSLKEFIDENAQQLGDKAQQLRIAALAFIADSYNNIMKKGHTVGIVIEITGSVGLGPVLGRIEAFDKNGRSTFGFAGITAGATAGIAVAGGLIYFKGLRDGLQGWGGNFNASAAHGLIGAQWEAVMTGGKTGHIAKYGAGFEIALSVEFARTWLTSAETY